MSTPASRPRSDRSSLFSAGNGTDLLYRTKRVAAAALRAHDGPDQDELVRAVRDAQDPTDVLHLFPLAAKRSLVGLSSAQAAAGPPDHLTLRTSGSSGGVLELTWKRADLVRSRLRFLRAVRGVRIDHELPPAPSRPLLAMGASPLHASTQVFELAEAASGPGARIPIAGPLESIVERVVRNAPDHITTYPSVIAELLTHAPPGWFERLSVVLGGEHAPRSLKSELQDMGAAVIDTYGCTEVGIIALSTRTDLPLEVQSHDVLVEVIDAHSSRPGYCRIAVTGLHNTASPVVRYLLDDEVKVASIEGGFVTALEEVAAGADPAVLSIDGTPIPTRAIRGVLDSVLRGGSYRVAVAKGQLRAEVETVTTEVTAALQEDLVGSLRRWGVFGCDVTVVAVPSIAGGKATRRFAMEDGV